VQTPVSHSSHLRWLQIVFFASVLLYAGRLLFVPLSFGLLLAVVLYPSCRWLEAKGLSRGLSITAGLLLLLTITAALASMLTWQVVEFQKDLPQITSKATTAWKNTQQWLSDEWGISLEMQMNWLRNAAMNLSNRIGSFLVGTFNATINVLFFLIIVPLFTALLLYYRHILMQFLYDWLGTHNRTRIKTVAGKAVHTYHNYIKGLTFVYVIVGTLNSLGLWALGIKNPVVFGFVASVLTIIPYIGITVGALLPISVAWLMYDSIWYPLGVIAIFTFVQYLEANVIFPVVVGTQLKVNTLASMVALLAGGILWGVSGMILFLPFVAILKIIADDIDEWKPLRTLLSPLDEYTSTRPKTPLVKKLLAKKTTVPETDTSATLSIGQKP